MFEFLIELFNFITFNTAVEASGFNPGGENSGRSILATGLSLVLKKVLSLVVLGVVAIILATLPFKLLPDSGLFIVRAKQSADAILGKMLVGLPIFGLVLGVGVVFVNVFVNNAEMSSENRNNIMCILDNSKCLSNGTFNGSQVRFDSTTATFIEFINIFAGIVTALGIVGFVMAGFLYVMSAGDTKKVESAKSIFKGAGIGIVIAISVFAIVELLAGAFMTF